MLFVCVMMTKLCDDVFISGQLEDTKKGEPVKQNGPANGDSTKSEKEEKSR